MNTRRAQLDAIAAKRCAGAGSAHDYLHVRRVAATAETIALAEGADVDIAVASALLHELFNYPKNHPESSRSGEVCAVQAAGELRALGYDAAFVNAAAYAIRVHPFSLGILPETLEAKILQDADRLDAIGAIGIARCFATCTEMKRPFYAPADPFCRDRSPDDKAWGLDHFYQKLLRIPASLHTESARRLAQQPVAFLNAYLDQLSREIRLPDADIQLWLATAVGQIGPC